MLSRHLYIVNRTETFEIKAQSAEEAVRLSEVYSPDAVSVEVERAPELDSAAVVDLTQPD